MPGHGAVSELPLAADLGDAAPATPPSTPTVTIDEAHEHSVDASTTAFSAGEGGSHTRTQWQIRVQGGATVYDPGDDDTNLTSITGAGFDVPLEPDDPYEIRARHKESSGLYSEWSDWEPFTTEAWSVAASSITITVASAEVDTTLTDFPVAVDLSAMPASFWSNVDAAGDEIRVFNADASRRLPVDVVRIDLSAETGWAWFLADSLSASADTEFDLDLDGAGEADFDMDEVWDDYLAVVMAGDADLTNRVDGTEFTRNGAIRGYEEDTGSRHFVTTEFAHQGAAWDGTHYYLFGTNAIRKYDASWNLVASNLDPRGDSGLTNNTHMGDGCVVDGFIWVGIDADGGPYLSKFNASDLSHAGVNWAVGVSVSSIAHNPDDGLLYCGDFPTGASAPGYDPDTGTLGNTITFSSAFGSNSVQGMTFYRGLLYVSDSATNRVYEVALDGTVHGAVFNKPINGIMEGMDFNDDGLILVVYATASGDAITFWPETLSLDLCGGGGFRMFNATGSARMTESIGSDADRTTLTIGVSFAPADNTQDSIAGFAPTGGGNTHRMEMAVDDGDKLGVWDNDNSWLYCSPNVDPPLTPTMSRVHAVYDGTTERRIYTNGSPGNTDSTITAKGGAGGAEVIFVVGDAFEGGGGNPWNGRIGFAYFREGDVGDAWIAAEYSMLNDNATFLSVGGSVGPSTPTVTVTGVSATGVSAETSAFVSGGGGAHEGTDWRITRVSDDAVVYDPGLDTTNKTSIVNAGSTVPLDTANVAYKIEARHGEST